MSTTDSTKNTCGHIKKLPFLQARDNFRVTVNKILLRYLKSFRQNPEGSPLHCRKRNREREREIYLERRNRVRYWSKLMSNPLNKGNGTRLLAKLCALTTLLNYSDLRCNSPPHRAADSSEYFCNNFCNAKTLKQSAHAIFIYAFCISLPIL